MNRTLQIRIKDVYGRETYYPVNETAQLFAQLAKQRTLTRETLDIAKRLGYTVEALPRSL
jgi:hypothetical protein